MDQVELIIALVVFVATILGAVLYLRSDSRANRQEWKADLALVLSAVNALTNEVDVLKSRLTALEAKVDALDGKLETEVGALDAKLEAKISALDAKFEARFETLSEQMQRNHRELLIRLAFHHHGDGRYPVAPATDPDPVDPPGGE